LKFYKGKPIIDPETKKPYFEHEYSDNLLMFLLKAAKPDKYKDRFSSELSGPDGKPVQIVQVDWDSLRTSSAKTLPDPIEERLKIAEALVVKPPGANGHGSANGNGHKSSGTNGANGTANGNGTSPGR
jgi:hypothetical protein